MEKEVRMSNLSQLDLEGRLHGQRRVLAAIMAHLMAREGEDFGQLIDAQLEMSDHQEDPGAVPDPAFAAEAAAALEIRLVLERAREIREGL
jgi:hypothetical protein